MVDLDEELNEIAGHLNAQHARLAGVARELLDDPAKWASEGIFTIERYLCWKTGISRSHAQQIADIARRGNELPECLEAFERGELSLDQATVVARRAPGWADAEVTALAKLLTVDQLRRSVGRYPFPVVPDSMLPGAAEPGSPADGADDSAADGLIGPPLPADHRAPEPLDRMGHGGGCCGGEADPVDQMSFGFDDAGRFHLHLDTDQLTGMIIDRSLEEARDALFQGGQTDVNWIDAIREMANRSLDAVASPSRRNRWRINMNLSTNGQATDGAGFSLPDAIRQYVTCDGYITPVFLDNGVPVSVGRSQHIVPDRTRRVVEHRDGGCAVPGCNARHFLEVHHIIHWEHDGVTETWNLICLCPHHHRLHHRQTRHHRQRRRLRRRHLHRRRRQTVDPQRGQTHAPRGTATTATGPVRPPLRRTPRLQPGALQPTRRLPADDRPTDPGNTPGPRRLTSRRVHRRT